MTNSLDAYNRDVAVLRFVAIYLMTIIHIPSIVADDLLLQKNWLTLDASTQLSYLFIDGFCRISAPLLGLISGFFAFQELKRRSPFDLIMKRTRSLIVPAILWSALLATLLMANGLLFGKSNALGNWYSGSTINMLLGVTQQPINGPMHYLIDLFKCMCILAVLFAVRESWSAQQLVVIALAGASMLILSDLNQDHPGFNRNSVLMRADLFLFFFAGVALGCRNMSPVSLDERLVPGTRKGLFVILGAVFLICATQWTWLLRSESITANTLGLLALFATRISGAVLLFCIIIKLPERVKNLLANQALAFRLFCSHLITFILIDRCLVNALGFDGYAGYQRVLAINVFPLCGLLVAYISLYAQMRLPVLRHARV